MQSVQASSLSLLRSHFQGELLAWLFLHPEEEFSLIELARRLGVSHSTASREADRFAAAGLGTGPLDARRHAGEGIAGAGSAEPPAGAVRAQLDPPLGGVLRPFDRMRRRRNEVEHPATGRPALGSADVITGRAKVGAIVELAGKVLDQMSPY